jgi:drug/metabolite transporter (DMT)-like permease
MKPVHYAALALLGAVWGASFLFIGVAVPEFGPLTLMFARVLIAGLIMLGVAAITQRRSDWRAALRLRDNWRKYLVVGLLNSALPFTLIAYSELRLPVSLAAILNSTTPLFTALIAAAWGNEALSGRKIAGVLLGVAGVAVLVGGAPLTLGPAVLLAVLASLLAALSYGAATVYAARHLSGLPATLASAVQLLAATVWLAVPGTLAAPATLPSATAIGALAALILLSTTFAYVLYFYLLRRVGPTRTASVTFLVPVFATLWAVLFLREPFGPGMLAGMAIILLSVGLVTRKEGPVTSDELRVTSSEARGSRGD